MIFIYLVMNILIWLQLLNSNLNLESCYYIYVLLLNDFVLEMYVILFQIVVEIFESKTYGFDLNYFNSSLTWSNLNFEFKIQKCV
jgi:hypothetical protein